MFIVFCLYCEPLSVCESHLVMSSSLLLMDCSLPGSSDHGILQARTLEWIASAFSGCADGTTFMAESEEELKSLLMKVRKEWKSWLKIQHSEN